MENKKVVLITIIILLCIFAPLTIIGFIFKDNRNLLDENPKHERYYNNYIWFYDENDKFISKYECETEICKISVPTIDDETYEINYYKNGEIKEVPVVDNIHTFITDGSLIYLYNVTNGMKVSTYKSIKNYSTKLENDTFILQNEDGLWGAITVGDTLNRVLGFEYDFVGLKNNVNSENILSTEKFIVSKDSKWYIVDNSNNAISGYIDNPIIDYNDKYIFSKNGENIEIYSYDNFKYLNNFEVKKYIIEDEYIGIITDNFLLIYNDLGVDYIKSITISNINDEILLEKAENKLNVKVNNEILESIELN